MFHRHQFLRYSVGVDGGQTGIEQRVLSAGSPTGVSLVGELVG